MDNDEETLGPGPQCGDTQDISESESHFPEQESEVGKMLNGDAHGHAESKHDDPTSANPDGCENESAEPIKEATMEEQQLDLKPELQEGLKIVNYFIADRMSEPFRDEVFSQLSEADIEKYKRDIAEPMCLFRMKKKFQTGEYTSITQVVSDFNLMIYNCQRFNGTSHPVSKMANKMSIILKQKLNLLRPDIRSKIAQDGSTPWTKQENQDGSVGAGFRKRTANHRLDDSSEMLNQLRMVEEQKAKDERRLKKEEQRAAQAAVERELIDWEEENVTVEPVKSIIRHSWELPQIGLFLFLCREALQLEEVPMYELERCLAMPRQSRRLQQVMTALLSTPYQREKRAEKSLPDMPYSLWSRKLMEMADTWYKELNTCHGDVFFASCRLGLVERCFEVMGVKNPLREKPFHSLGFYRQMWILKSVCDYLVEKEENLRTAIESQDPIDQRGLLLGTDRHGNQYIHFTQFCGPNLRVYRQRKPPVPVVKEEEEEEEEENPKVKPVKGKSRAKRKLNLDGSSAKRSRSATPLNDSETDGTVSPAPSDVRSKSRASSSRHSSPLPREANGRSRQTSARNSPAPDSSSVDSFSINIPFGKGRRTRNSAESTFYENIENIDLECLFRQRSRRSRGAKNAAKEMADAESVSTVGDESSQDGLRADTPSSSSALDGGDVKTEMELVNGKLSTEESAWTQAEVRSESQDSCDVDSVSKADQSASHSHVGSLKGDRTESSGRVHIKSEPDSSKCDTESDVHTGECDKSVGICDRQVETGVRKKSLSPESVDTAVVDGAPATDGRSAKLPTTCDTHSAASRNPSSNPSVSAPFPNTSTSAVSVKKEIGGDDSGFVSFQTTPHVASGAGPICDDDDVDKHVDQHIPGSEEKSGTGHCDSDSVKVKQEGSDAKSAREQSEEGCVVRTEAPCLQNEDSVSSSQCGGTLDSKDTVSKALLDHVDYSEEEMGPDPEEFELIVEDMEGLDRLIKQFEPEQVDASPQVSPALRAGKRQKSKSTPKAAKRWVCEKELYERLLAMQSELQPFRSKLAILTKKARLKLQKEFQNFVEETSKVEDLQAWESESDSDQNSDESGVEESQSGNDSDDSEDAPMEAFSAPAKVNNVPSKPSSTASVESAKCDQRDIEEYEADVSSRGRLRKRRLIPNNVEDQGVKKKKMVKKAEEAPPPPPVTSASQVSGLVCRSEDGTIKLNISNSQFLAMMEQGGSATSELVQQLAAAKFPSGQTLGCIKVIGGPIPHNPDGSGAQKAPATQASAHPVIQKILSTQGPPNVRPVTGLAVQRKKTDTTPTSASGVCVQSTAVTSVAVTSSVMSVSRAGGAAGLNLQSSLLMTASMKGGKQQVYVVTPEQQEELLRRGILRPEHRQVVPAAGSILRPQAGVTVTSGNATGVITVPTLSHFPKPLTAAAIQHVLHPQSQGQGQVTLQGQPDILAATSIIKPGVQIAGQVVMGGPVGVNRAQGGVGPVTAVKIVPSSNGQERVGVPVVVGQVVPHSKATSSSSSSSPAIGLKAPVVVNNAGGSRTLILQSGKSMPRYAGNVTVKELLENRAANKAEDGDGPKMTSTDSSSENPSMSPPSQAEGGRVVVTTGSIGGVMPPLSVMSSRLQRPGPVGVPLVQGVLPGMKPRAGQSALDDALQTVVTSYTTTLPTAHIKVPSPTTLPSLSPRKDITRIVRSTKAPIPATTRMQAKHSSVVLASSLVSGSAPLPTGGNRAVSGVVPPGTVVRPGAVVLPSGQTLDMAGKEPFVLQVIPRGAAGASNTPQRYILPQAAASVLQMANKTLPATPTIQERCVLVVTQASVTVASTRSPSSSTVHAGLSPVGLQQLSQHNHQRLLVTPPFSSTGGASSPAVAASFSSSAAITKNTSEVLKSMLAAKSMALTNNPVPAAFCSSASAVLHNPPVTSCAGVAQVSTQSGPYLSHQTVASFTQMPPVIRAPLTGVVSAVSSAQQTVNHTVPRVVQTPVPVGLQMQNLAMAGLPVSVKSTPSPVDSQRVGVPGVVRVSLPAGLQVAGLQPGGAAIRLVPSSQAGNNSGSSLQPVLAAVKSGTQGLQQLQILAAAGGLQGIQLSGQAQPQVALKAATGAGQGAAGQQTVSLVTAPAEEQKQAVQLCFTMQPGGQGVISTTAASPMLPQAVVPRAAPGMRGATSAVQGGFSVLASSPLSPCNSGSVSKVIMASPATSLPLPASLQPSSVVNQSPVTSLKSAENRLMLSVTPGTVKSQFIISPVSSQSAGDGSHALLRQQSVPSQTLTTDSRDKPALFTHATPHLQRALKHSLSSSDMQPIPAKKACLDMGSMSSGAVLASLNQTMSGGGINTCGGDSSATTASGRDSNNESVPPRVIMASSAGDNSASCTLLNLAAHVSPGNGAAPTCVPSGAALSVPLLQQLGGMAPLMGRPPSVTAAAAVVAQKQVVAVRSVGGQLLTDSNIPVTENNGQYKVLPKATLQIGSQTVTVLSPSDAMIQNVRSAVNTSMVRAAPHGQTPTSVTPSIQTSPAAGVKGGEAVGTAGQSQGGIVRTILRPDMKPETVFSMYPQAPLKSSPQGSQSDRIDVGPDSGRIVVTSPIMTEPAAMKQMVLSMNNTPLLKARLEQPRLGQCVGVAGVPVPRDTVNGVSGSEQRVSEGGSNTEHKSAQSSALAASGRSAQDCTKTDSKKLEEEAALNLLTLANQR
ncbi:hypothetical protein ACOMHN_038023 [Nucella lapillus]